jgi:AmpE protein
MTFLAIIIAVLLLQAWGSAGRLHCDSWFDSWQARIASWGLGPGLSLVLTVLLPALVVQLLLHAVAPLLFGLGWLLFATVLLLYSFGRGDFQASMAQYRSYAYAGDFEAAYLAAREKFNWDASGEAPDTALEVHAMVQRALLYEGFQRWFTVMFYFVLLGPAGALAYRLSQLYRANAQPGIGDHWLFLLDWLPARLLASTFALTGDFIGSRDQLLAAWSDTAAQASAVLYPVGVAALGSDASSPSGEDAVVGPGAAAQNREFDALLSRSAVCWIVVLSLLVLFF